MRFKNGSVEDMWFTIQNGLKRLCLEANDVAIIMTCFPSSHSMKDFLAENSTYNNQLTLADGGPSHFTVNGKLFSIFEWDEVSSLEWPVVILVVFGSDNYYIGHLERYRALSRATVEAIVIDAKYPAKHIKIIPANEKR